jgi:hypothetical protein
MSLDSTGGHDELPGNLQIGFAQGEKMKNLQLTRA